MMSHLAQQPGTRTPLLLLFLLLPSPHLFLLSLCSFPHPITFRFRYPCLQIRYHSLYCIQPLSPIFHPSPPSTPNSTSSTSVIIIIIRQHASYLLDAPVSGADSVADREATPTNELNEGGETVWNCKYRLVLTYNTPLYNPYFFSLFLSTISEKEKEKV